jgi:hypothetical protein
VRKWVPIMYRHGVDAHRASLDPSRHKLSRPKVLRHHSSAELSTLGVVGEFQRFGLGLDSEERYAWSAWFGLVDIRGLSRVYLASCGSQKTWLTEA